MPRPATRTRILSAGAAAAAAVASLSLFLSPPADVDPLGTLGRADASPSSAGPDGPEAFGVPDVDLAAVGYRGPDLGAVTLESLSAPFPELPTERAADIRDRIARATPHLQALHQAKNLLARSLAEHDHHVHAAKVAVVEADAAFGAARDELDAARARVAPPRPDEGGPDLLPASTAPSAAASSTGEPVSPATAAVDPVADVVALAAAEARAADADAARLAAWAELDQRQANRRAHREAAQRAEHEVWRMDAHVRWLEYEQWLAQGAMPSAGNWLVQEERTHGDLPIVEVRGFRVHRAIADSVRQLVDSAAAAGIDLEGAAYRPVDEQIALRRQNCGPTAFDVYEKAPGLCSPPTAKPGRSLHELGLAIDLANGANSIVSRSDPAFRWLARHAPSYGLYNLPAEPWHWSITGQ